MNTVQEFISAHGTIFGIVSAVSLILLVLTLIAIPIVVVYLPADYIVSSPRRVFYRHSRNAGVNIFLIVCKNILGVCLIMMGTVMLITPGQGLLTILAGIAVGNLPGKYRLERWLITRPPVWRTIQYLRRKAGVAPLQMPLPDSFH